MVKIILKSAVRGFARSQKGKSFLAASHFDAKGNKTPKREVPPELGESNNNRRAVDSVISAGRNVARAELARLSAMVPGTTEGDKAIHKEFGVAAGPDAHIGYSRARHQEAIVRLNQQIMGESTLQKIRRVLKLGEMTRNNTSEIARNTETLDRLLGMSAEEKQKRYGSQHPDPTIRAAHNEQAYRNHVALVKRNLNAAKAAAGLSVESYIGEAKKKTDGEELEPKSASVFPKAHHWNNAKRVYGVPLGVKLQDIGGFGVDKDGNRVSRKELVQRHAFAAANSASKFTPEQKRAWVQAKIAKAVAAKKAREDNK